MSLSQADDATLLHEIVDGNQEALKQLYSRYRARLYSYLWHQLDGNAGRVEEVMQDVFFAAWRTAHIYRGEAQVATWLFRIAHHQAANMRRAAERRPEGHLVEIQQSEEEYAEHEAPFCQASHEEVVVNRIVLAQAMHQLSPRHREVLDLVFVQGFALAEVAHILNVPLGTVKSRISYARQALLSLLQQEEVHHD